MLNAAGAELPRRLPDERDSASATCSILNEGRRRAALQGGRRPGGPRGVRLQPRPRRVVRRRERRRPPRPLRRERRGSEPALRQRAGRAARRSTSSPPARARSVADTNAGMGIAADGRPSVRHQLARARRTPSTGGPARAASRGAGVTLPTNVTAGWGDSWVD